MSKITLACDWCKQTFQRHPCRLRPNQKRHFCSRPCFDAWRKVNGIPERRKLVNVKCTQCGKALQRIPARLRANAKQFCDMKCRDVWMSENWRGSNNPNAGKLFNVPCTQCGKIIVRPRWHKAKAEHPFCSMQCYAQWQSINRRGSNSPSWLGGRSFEPYSVDFSLELKQNIRARDGFCCRMCGKTEQENRRKLHVHHINYDKSDQSPSNLISLCCSCHSKTNFNRASWEELLTSEMGLLA